MNSKYILLPICFFLINLTIAKAQQAPKYKILTIGFYNLENLFDPADDPRINDEEFTPEGKKAWTVEKYLEKLTNMAYVISQIGIDKNPLGLSILGVAEIENKKVLEDLVKEDALKERGYNIIHYDSPDRRGIDVAMLYNPQHFTPLYHDTIPLKLYNSKGNRRYSRNILWIKGILDGDTTHIVVNHWPSRSGGEKRSEPSRKQAAYECRNFLDSLYTVNPDYKAIIMGDLNDDPNSKSVRYILSGKSRIREVKGKDLFNPMADLYRRGVGSNAYRDSWSLFDQILLSKGWLSKNQKGYFFHQAYVFNKKTIIQASGKYKGYPFRTFSGDIYQGGYSDHFPVYSHLLKKIN